MSQPLPVNPWSSHSYQVPRYPHQCHFPGCHFPVGEAQMLCELHGAPHKPRQADNDDDE